jgi:hypothetical protein
MKGIFPITVGAFMNVCSIESASPGVAIMGKIVELK